MQTSLECLVCFMQQTLATAKLSTTDTTVQREVVKEAARLIAEVDMSISPPVNAIKVYSLISAMTHVNDPFAAVKKKSTELALSIRESVRHQIETSPNPINTAVRYAIASNIIDYGTQHNFNALDTLSRCQKEEFCIDEFDLFEQEVLHTVSPHVLYLADNCGEVVFDGLLIEQLIKVGCSVKLVVREDVILNDVTIQEAKECGITELCTVLKSGTMCPGTPLGLCSEEIQEAFWTSDIIISKGQGNFETLSDEAAPIFFMLTAKCNVVAQHIAAKKNVSMKKIQGKGEMVLMRQEKRIC